MLQFIYFSTIILWIFICITGFIRSVMDRNSKIFALAGIISAIAVILMSVLMGYYQIIPLFAVTLILLCAIYRMEAR